MQEKDYTYFHAVRNAESWRTATPAIVPERAFMGDFPVAGRDPHGTFYYTEDEIERVIVPARCAPLYVY